MIPPPPESSLPSSTVCVLTPSFLRQLSAMSLCGPLIAFLLPCTYLPSCLPAYLPSYLLSFRTQWSCLQGVEGQDFIAIRRLHWLDGWPTIWTPIDVVFDTKTGAGGSQAVGEKVGIKLASTGAAGSVAAFDRVTLASTGSALTKLPPKEEPIKLASKEGSAAWHLGASRLLVAAVLVVAVRGM